MQVKKYCPAANDAASIAETLLGDGLLRRLVEEVVELGHVGDLQPGAYTSAAAFTDSTVAAAAALSNFAPTLGKSTKTRSPSFSCAKGVIPTVATSPSSRSHSWSLVYLEPCNVFGGDHRGFALVRVAPQEALTSIFFAGFCASGFLGRVTVRTPFLNAASILSASTSSGICMRRSNEPYRRSER